MFMYTKKTTKKFKILRYKNSLYFTKTIHVQMQIERTQ